jgi:hypothetical protein
MITPSSEDHKTCIRPPSGAMKRASASSRAMVELLSVTGTGSCMRGEYNSGPNLPLLLVGLVLVVLLRTTSITLTVVATTNLNASVKPRRPCTKSGLKEASIYTRCKCTYVRRPCECVLASLAHLYVHASMYIHASSSSPHIM